ncbi:hypothetical protein [uncultured Thiodictyon sp.]|uniref:hypothetical protein n=1 Tax=uncultured Thiodictyon sp. TaxID=1846217 RepID=UPI0025D37CA4|nr:hypothetical protein [uncultured Thiodictyon sp.]
MTTATQVFCAATIICVAITGCCLQVKRPPAPRLTSGDGKESVQDAVNVCATALDYYERRSREGAAWNFGISTSGVLAGVLGAALVAASPANVTWVAVFSAYAGATNATVEKLNGAGMDGGTAKDDYSALHAAVEAAIVKAITTTDEKEKTTVLKEIRSKCELKLAPRQDPSAPPPATTWAKCFPMTCPPH